MKHKVIRRISRPDSAVMKILGDLGTATISEAQGRTGLLNPYMRPIYPSARMCGPAVTALCQPGDNIMIHAAVEVCQPGDVLVVAVTSETTDGFFGELLGTSLQVHGVVGLVIDAGVRDVAELTAMDFPVWSRAISSQGTVKSTAGSVNVPVVCAGQLIHPGDVIMGDQDGAVVVPRAEAAEVAKAGQARVAKEEKAREKLRAGELGLDMYGLRAKLLEMGVVYVDEEPQ
jgi:4-hydroxy-4-methyl-2-oxoglutarate aldolase